LKLLKRQMYGRAKFDLLKARVLNPMWIIIQFSLVKICSFLSICTKSADEPRLIMLIRLKLNTQ
jgi:hypothetical protein